MRNSEIIWLLYLGAYLQRVWHSPSEKQKRSTSIGVSILLLTTITTKKTLKDMSSLTNRNRLFFFLSFFFYLDNAYFTAELTKKALFYTLEEKSSLEVCTSSVCFPKQKNRLLPFKAFFLPKGWPMTGAAGAASSLCRHGNWQAWSLLSGPFSREQCQIANTSITTLCMPKSFHLLLTEF